jgi:hypothetical protein
MAAVAAVALNFAVIRSFDQTSANGSFIFFVCGVMPMASLLVLAALFSAPRMLRCDRLPSFLLGFEGMGWVMVFVFVTGYSLAQSQILAAVELIAVRTRPFFSRYLVDTPDWVGLVLELGFGIVIFSLPQLVVALLGGLLTRRFGLTCRFERYRGGPVEQADSGSAALEGANHSFRP